MLPDFRKPFFVRNDNESELAVSLVLWNDDNSKVAASIRLVNGEGNGVLVDVADWQRIKSAVDKELNLVLDI